MRTPVFDAAAVRRAVGPLEALAAVRAAFVAHARGEWRMAPKVYVPSDPSGDFRAMPAIGDGFALLKWVTSFPRNPHRGLPTVSGVVLLSDAEDGRLLALLDAAAVTALRTAAAGVLAGQVLGRSTATSWSVVGAGVNGAETVRLLKALALEALVHDRDAARADGVAATTGAHAVSLSEALEADVVVTVTPGAHPVVGEGVLSPGQHVSLMGADGPGKAEIALEELVRGRLFCDDWSQASHGGELARAVQQGGAQREYVTELGAVLTGDADGRRADDDITLFDSTGLAIQDLAIAVAAYRRAADLDLAEIAL